MAGAVQEGSQAEARRGWGWQRTSEETWDHIQNYHMDDRGWSDIGYNFLIGEDGRVYEDRGWSTMGAHAKSWNHKSLGFSFLGTFSSRVPSAAALNAAQSLIQCTIKRGSLSSSYTLKGHRNVNATECPGNALYRVISWWASAVPPGLTINQDSFSAKRSRTEQGNKKEKKEKKAQRKTGPSERKMLLLMRVMWFSVLCAVALGCPSIVTRSQWRGQSPRSRDPLKTRLPYIIIHHTAGNRCSTLADCSREVKNIQSYHMNSNGWDDIGYNFLIGEDGKVYEGRGWSTRGAHAKGWNDKSLGLAFLGNFSSRVPSAAALFAARRLIQCAVSRGSLSRSYTLKGARDVISTISPGDALYGAISRWARFKA
ncbi:peptidoglycan recognition protein 1 [Gopherus flavomarginatus]|uniref:peptidoglycan recognition protein 1 n=1 Tax=Gopherus flavomarginatus TaxID=286002 RepID=UPI0021CBE954|nr:peptidoglycan recognition protein 1 [Gopherus flavomarginatus]